MGELNIYNRLYAEIKNNYGVAGLMGNLFVESGLISCNIQNSCMKKMGITDEQYVQMVDNGTYKDFCTDRVGTGLAQWTSSGRKTGLYNFIKQKGTSIADENAQIDYLIYELKIGYKKVFDVLKNAKSLNEASDIVVLKFEAPASVGKNASEETMNKTLATRLKYSQTFYDKYATENKYFRIQLGAFKKFENAVNLQKRLKDSGFASIIKEKNGYYKCQLGAFKNKPNADNMLKSVKEKGFNAFVTYE